MMTHSISEICSQPNVVRRFAYLKRSDVLLQIELQLFRNLQLLRFRSVDQ